VDGFKGVSDQHGHAAGEALLAAFGERLRRTLRGADTVARLGHDEFAVILEELHRPEEACLVAQKIIDAMRAPVLIGQQAFVISTSIGIVYSVDADAGASLAQADKALYAAKRAGRNRFELAPLAPDNVIQMSLPGKAQEG
jgi:diguanylate cyclase (GGDEF)-like protein